METSTDTPQSHLPPPPQRHLPPPPPPAVPTAAIPVAEPTVVEPRVPGPPVDDSKRTPWYRRPLLWVLFAALLIVGGVLALALRGDDATDPIAGVYEGSGDQGLEIEFTVDEGAESISELFVAVTCGPISRSEAITFEPALPVENGRFDVAAAGGFGIDGRFTDGGAAATGGWATGTCSGAWDAQRTGVAAAAPPSDEPEAAPPAEPEPPMVVDFSDDFDGVIDGRWRWALENPDTWSLATVPGALEITALDTISNVLVRDAPDGPYEITTAVRFRPSSNFQFAGLIVAAEGMEASWMQLGRAFCDPSAPVCVGDGVYFDEIDDGDLVAHAPVPITTDTDVVFLRIVRDGDTYDGFYSIDGERWVSVGQIVRDLPNPEIGITAGQANEVPLPAQFDYFTVTSPPSGDAAPAADSLIGLAAAGDDATTPAGTYVSCTDTEYSETALGTMVGATIRDGAFGAWIIRVDGMDVEAESAGDCAGLVLGADQQVLIGRQGPDSPWQSVGFYVIE